MFKALKKQKTGAGERKPGDDMPEALDFSAKSIRMLVDSGAIEWVGRGGKYGPSAEAVAELKASEKAKAAQAAPAAPVSRAEFEAALVRIKALEDLQSEGPALAAKPAPSPAKGERRA